LVGMKCAILLNRSTTTMMASKPLDGGKLTMKSMDTLSHDPSRIGKGPILIEGPILLACQASLHILLYIVFQIEPIVGLLKECCGVFYTMMARKRPIMTFLQKHILYPPFQNIESILLVPQ